MLASSLPMSVPSTPFLSPDDLSVPRSEFPPETKGDSPGRGDSPTAAGRGRRPARTLPEQIADELGTALIAGQYAVGQRLREQELADRYAVSRGPVREALRLLDRRGMVLLTPRRGAHVREQSLDAIADLFNVRMALSLLAARQAALRPIPSYLEALGRRVGEMEALAAQAVGEAQVFADVTTRAVRAVIKASGNVHAATLIAELSEQTVWRAIWTWPLDYASPERRLTQAGHFRRVLEALEAGDPDASEERLRLALEESRDIAVATLARLRGQVVDPVRLLRTAPQASRSRA